jgi:hypothetical protein
VANTVRRIGHERIHRSIPDPAPNGQGTPNFGTTSFGYSSDALKDPVFMSKALVSALLLTYFAIALGYAIRYRRRKLHPTGPDATRFSSCCDPPCADCNEP